MSCSADSELGEADNFILTIDEDIFHDQVAGQRGFISGLNDDVLWKIFMINADVEPSRPWRVPTNPATPLVVTWTCSHVCRQWREIILRSASLWGYLIDLDVLARVKQEWQFEILRRTGQSPLIVSGSHFPNHQAKEKLLGFILDNYWPRIESLHVAMSGQTVLQNGSWTCLYRPASMLKSIRIETSRSLQTSIDAPGQIFSGYAPFLNSIKLGNLAYFIAPNTPWISGITCLDIYTPQSMSVGDWIDVLSQMPLIQALSISQSYLYPSPGSKTSRHLHLRHLDNIRFVCHSSVWASLLEQIQPGPLCKIYLVSFGADKDHGAGDSSLLKKILSSYPRYFFKSQTVGYLYLQIWRDSFRMSAAPRETTHGRPPFYIAVSTMIHGDPISASVEPLADCDLHHVKTLKFETSSSRILAPQYYRLFSTLGNLENLIVNDHGIDTLWKLIQITQESSASESLFFPRLKALCVNYVWTAESFEILVRFISSRNERLAPIEVLDITCWDDKARPTMLDSFSGMVVIYREGKGIGRHICGTSKSKDTWIKRSSYVPPYTYV